MNRNRIQGRWKQLKGKLKEHWGKLTDDDLDVIAGRRDQLLGRIQHRHGVAHEDADRQARQENPSDARLDESRDRADKTR